MLLHRCYAVLDIFAIALEMRTELLNVLKLPVLFSVEPILTIFKVVMSTIHRQNVLKEEKNRSNRIATANHGVVSLNEEEAAQGRKGTCSQRICSQSTLRAKVDGCGV